MKQSEHIRSCVQIYKFLSCPICQSQVLYQRPGSLRIQRNNLPIPSTVLFQIVPGICWSHIPTSEYRSRIYWLRRKSTFHKQGFESTKQGPKYTDKVQSPQSKVWNMLSSESKKQKYDPESMKPGKCMLKQIVVPNKQPFPRVWLSYPKPSVPCEEGQSFFLASSLSDLPHASLHSVHVCGSGQEAATPCQRGYVALHHHRLSAADPALLSLGQVALCLGHLKLLVGHSSCIHTLMTETITWGW